MRIRNQKAESFIKSFAFSCMLCLVWGTFSVVRGRTLLEQFEIIELLWFIYNVTLSFLFLIRTKPLVVSMDLTHWMVALVTSFSGFLFSRTEADPGSVLLFSADVLMVFAVSLGIITALILGRSYDFLPALRAVKTGYAYQVIKHPMYLSSILIKIGYTLKNPSIYNVFILIIILILYDRRAKYEEKIMSHSSGYLDYLKKVKYRFIPGVY